MKYHVITDPQGDIVYNTNDLEEAREFAKSYPLDAYVLEDTALGA